MCVLMIDDEWSVTTQVETTIWRNRSFFFILALALALTLSLSLSLLSFFILTASTPLLFELWWWWRGRSGVGKRLNNERQCSSVLFKVLLPTTLRYGRWWWLSVSVRRDDVEGKGLRLIIEAVMVRGAEVVVDSSL